MRNKVLLVVGLMTATILAGTASAVEVGIQDGGVVGSKWSFDIKITNPTGVSAQAFQATLQIAGPGALALDAPGSVAVATDPAYWVVGNSQGANAIDKGSSKYQFGDGPNNGISELLQTGDIMARFKFDWTTPGWYTINVDTGTSPLNTFVTDGNFVNQAVSVSSNGLQVYVPEPASVLLLAVALPFARRRTH